MEDTLVLGTSASQHKGSSPFEGTKHLLAGSSVGQQRETDNFEVASSSLAQPTFKLGVVQ